MTFPSPVALVREITLMPPMLVLSMLAFTASMAAILTSGARSSTAAGLARRSMEAVIRLTHQHCAPRPDTAGRARRRR